MQSEALIAKERIGLSEPHIAGNEWKYVKECLDTGWVSSVGSFVDRFEQDLATRSGTKYAVATSSGTSALHLALLAVGIQAGDEVIVPSLTFIAPANAVRYVGAWPVFIDAEDRFWQMDLDRLTEFLGNECSWVGRELRNATTGRRIAAILPVHILGHPVEMSRILALAQEYRLKVIEDATESLGSLYAGKPTGSLGDAGCFSFNGNKIITTGGGGALVTNDLELARTARYISTQAKDDPIEYRHSQIGYNYRLTNIQAAMGCAQLENLDSYVSAKREIAQRYLEAFAMHPFVSLQQEAANVCSNRWLYTIRLLESSPITSRELMNCLGQHEVQARPLWQPLHLSEAHKQFRPRDKFPVSEQLNLECLSLPSSVGMSPQQQQRVIDHVCVALDRRASA